MNVFTLFFRDKGHSLRIYDVDCSKSEVASKKYGVQWFDSEPCAVSNADLVILCTPIRETPKVIQEVIQHMKKGSTLCEIASLKTRTAAALSSTEDRCIQPLSIHPMFGPDIGKMEGQTIVVVPIRDCEMETSLTRELFPRNEVVVIDAETHDSCMATILALPYFMNLVFAKTIPVGNMALLRRLAGTTFTVQLAVAQSIVGESPELIESLINENVFSGAYISKFIDESNNVRGLLDKEPDGIKEYCDALHAEMIKDPEEVKSMRIRNALFENLKVNKVSSALNLFKIRRSHQS